MSPRTYASSVNKPGQSEGRDSVKSESGMVTVETAIGLGAVLFVFVALLLGIASVQKQSELCDLVRVGARAYSVGSDPTEALGGATNQHVSLEVVDEGSVFTAVGTTPGLKLGSWEVAILRCEISGIAESRWIGHLMGSREGESYE